MILCETAAVLDPLTKDVPARRATLIAAVSGGADSSALAEVLGDYCGPRDIRLVLCHYDHGLRSPEAALADLAQVGALADRLHAPLLRSEAAPGEVEHAATTERSGIEAAARKLRYRFFSHAARLCGASWLCTGHTRDDQVETVLLGLERGVGEMGLAGIPVTRDLTDSCLLVRPLLNLSREALKSFLADRGVSWREDETNASLAFDRNRIRHEVLPELERRNPGIRDALIALQQDASAARHRAELEAADLEWEESGERSTITCDSFFSASSAGRLVSLFREARRRGMIRASSRLCARYFAPLLDPEPPAHGRVVSGRGQVIRRVRERLVWEPDIVRTKDYGYLRCVRAGSRVTLPSGHTVTVYASEKGVTEPASIVIELNTSEEPLVVRSCRPGDRIHTSSGTKRIRSLLSEWGVADADRQGVPVVADRAGVLAVIGELYGGRNVVAERMGGAYSVHVLGVDRDG